VSTVGVALAVSTITAVLIQLPVERGLRRFSMRARFAWHTGCWLLAWTLGAMSGAVPGPARTALILAMMVVFSAGACVYHAVFQARLADLVPAAQTGRVNGLVSVAFNVGTVLGSAGFVLVLAQLSRSWQAFVLLGLGAAAAGVALQRFATATPNDEPAVA
jgi:MFS family permease